MRKALSETFRENQDWSEDRRVKPRSIRSPAQPHEFRHSVKAFFCSAPSELVLCWEPNFVYNKQKSTRLCPSVYLVSLIRVFGLFFFARLITVTLNPGHIILVTYLCMFHRIICPSGNDVRHCLKFRGCYRSGYSSYDLHDITLPRLLSFLKSPRVKQLLKSKASRTRRRKEGRNYSNNIGLHLPQYQPRISALRRKETPLRPSEGLWGVISYEIW